MKILSKKNVVQTRLFRIENENLIGIHGTEMQPVKGLDAIHFADANFRKCRTRNAIFNFHRNIL